MNTNGCTPAKRRASDILARFEKEPPRVASSGFSLRVESRRQALALRPAVLPTWWLLAGATLMVLLAVNLFFALQPNLVVQEVSAVTLHDEYVAQGVAYSQTLAGQ